MRERRPRRRRSFEALQLDPQKISLLLLTWRRLRQAKEFRRAVQCLQQSGAGSSQDPAVLLVLVKALFGAGSIPPRLDTGRKLSTIAEVIPPPFALGKLLVSKVNMRKQVNEFQLHTLQERDVAVYDNLGTACMKLGKGAEASRI